MNAVILARVSTKEQEDGHSIDAQVHRLEEHAGRKGFTVIKTFPIVESSTIGDRKKFMSMVKFIEEQKEPIVLIADAVDRVQRSFKETGMLDSLRKMGKVQLHFLRENIVLDENSRSFEIMMWNYAVMGAQGYVLAISDNVKRSIEEKIRKGEWIGQGPIGYFNMRTADDKSNIGLDELRAPLIRKIFELYASGSYSLRILRKIMADDGLTNPRTGRPITSSQIANILANPFYYGTMKIKGKLYPHRYAPIISESLFLQCQRVKAGKKYQQSNTVRKPFVLRGLVRCAYCGCLVTFDSKNEGRNVYAMCNQYKGKCGAVRMREEDLLEQIADVFNSMKVPEDVRAALIASLQNGAAAKQVYHEDAIKALRNEYDSLQKQLDRLLDLCLQGSITREVHDQKATQMKERQHEIDIILGQHTEADEKFTFTVTYLLSLASKAPELFKVSKVEQKQQLIKFVLSNMTLKGKELQYQVKKPFDALIECAKSQEWLPRLDSNQQPTG